MPKYIYQARDAMGRSDRGAIVASNVDEATRMLRGDGKTVVSLHEEAAARGAMATFHAHTGRIKRDEVIFFAGQLAVMVDTGVTLPDALDSIAEQASSPAMKSMVRDVCDQVKAGIEFSVALSKYPRAFSKLFVALVRVGEKSGLLSQMLVRVSDYMENERETRSKIKGAMTYPACLLTFCALVVVGLMVFVMPRFEAIYAGKKAALPMPTQLLLGASRGLLENWPLILAGVVASIVGAIIYFRLPSGRDLKDRLIINMPLLGPMYRKAFLARSLRTMSTMVGAGVGMLDVLELTSEVAGNRQYSRMWSNLIESVKGGASMSDHLMQSPLIPRTITQMISAGEKTGKLSPVMGRVANFCEQELKISVKTMTAMIEPAMIVIMGLIVGGIAMALLLPVFSISKVVSN